MLDLDDLDDTASDADLVAAAVAWHDLAAGEFIGPIDDGTAILAARAVTQAARIADSGGIGIIVVPAAFRALLGESSPAWDVVAARCLRSLERLDGTLELCVLAVDDHPELCPIDRPLAAAW